MTTAKEIYEYFNKVYPKKITSIQLLDEFNYAGEGQWFGLLIFYYNKKDPTIITNETFRNNESIKKNIELFEAFFNKNI